MANFVNVVPSDAAIECSDFSVDDYMNSIFPNEDSLAGTFKYFYLFLHIIF